MQGGRCWKICQHKYHWLPNSNSHPFISLQYRLKVIFKRFKILRWKVQSGVVGTLGAQPRMNVVTELTPFFLVQAVSMCWFWNWVPGKTPRCSNSSKQQQTCTLPLSSILTKKSLSQAEVYRGKYRKFVTWFARIFSEVSPGTAPTLVRSWDKREKPTGLRTNENKGSGLWPLSNSALMRLVWAEGRVPRQPGVLPVTQFQDQERGCYSLRAAIMWGSLESGASL